MKHAITFSTKGDLKKTNRFLNHAKKLNYDMLHAYGKLGVEALSKATPKDSGTTANSWYYEIVETKTGVVLQWNNSNLANGWAPIAILLQYGHATGGGGWVQGRDYINPAIRPIIDAIANNLWKEVTTA